MKVYQFTMTITLEAASEFAAKEKSEAVLNNLRDTAGHAPYSVELALDQDSCEEVELEEDEDEF